MNESQQSHNSDFKPTLTQEPVKLPAPSAFTALTGVITDATQNALATLNQGWKDLVANMCIPSLKGTAHPSPEAGMCAMEMVAFLEGKRHSDLPSCTYLLIAKYTQILNDSFTLEEREQYLKPRLARIAGTAEITLDQDYQLKNLFEEGRILLPRLIHTSNQPRQHLVQACIAVLDQMLDVAQSKGFQNPKIFEQIEKLSEFS